MLVAAVAHPRRCRLRRLRSLPPYVFRVASHAARACALRARPHDELLAIARVLLVACAHAAMAPVSRPLRSQRNRIFIRQAPLVCLHAHLHRTNVVQSCITIDCGPLTRPHRKVVQHDRRRDRDVEARCAVPVLRKCTQHAGLRDYLSLCPCLSLSVLICLSLSLAGRAGSRQTGRQAARTCAMYTKPSHMAFCFGLRPWPSLPRMNAVGPSCGERGEGEAYSGRFYSLSDASDGV
jgi:hypothetical protein